jgi:hypothetical protein
MTSTHYRKIISCIALVIPTLAFSQSSKIETLNREEQTWHKFSLFREAMNPKSEEEYMATLNWLRDRITAFGGVDSRYFVTYSALLGNPQAPSVKDTALAMAFTAELILRIEGARCKDQVEAKKISDQWIPLIQRQLFEFNNLPQSKRKKLAAFGFTFASLQKRNRSNDHRTGDRWQCAILPSYTEKIYKLEGVEFTQIPMGNIVNVMVSHPTIFPDFASDEEYESRKKEIISAARTKVDRE